MLGLRTESGQEAAVHGLVEMAVMQRAAHGANPHGGGAGRFVGVGGVVVQLGTTVFQHHVTWDPVKTRRNRGKHRVTFALAATVLDDPLALSVPDEDHSAKEERWLTLGQAANGMLLVVVHTYQEVGGDSARVRIISARREGKRERRQYESKR